LISTNQTDLLALVQEEMRKVGLATNAHSIRNDVTVEQHQNDESVQRPPEVPTDKMVSLKINVYLCQFNCNVIA
jgi:hypothetical protein